MTRCRICNNPLRQSVDQGPAGRQKRIRTPANFTSDNVVPVPATYSGAGSLYLPHLEPDAEHASLVGEPLAGKNNLQLLLMGAAVGSRHYQVEPVRPRLQ